MLLGGECRVEGVLQFLKGVWLRADSVHTCRSQKQPPHLAPPFAVMGEVLTWIVSHTHLDDPLHALCVRWSLPSRGCQVRQAWWWGGVWGLDGIFSRLLVLRVWPWPLPPDRYCCCCCCCCCMHTGVISTEVGYSNGTAENPTYEDVCGGATGHAEVVQVMYDPKEVG